MTHELAPQTAVPAVPELHDALRVVVELTPVKDSMTPEMRRERYMPAMDTINQHAMGIAYADFRAQNTVPGDMELWSTTGRIRQSWLASFVLDQEGQNG